MKAKNLTISETFNEFAKQTEDIDYNVEDLVSYCLENSLVFYWINIESIWGIVGFRWDEFNNRGHFEINPVKFNVLPKIPDPERIKSFKGMFSNLKSSTPMTIVHNVWENVDTLGNWNHPDVIINVDKNHNFIKISSTNSSSNSITNEGYYQDKITLKGGDYSKIQDIGHRVLVYDGEDFNFPLLTIFRDYPDNEENKYQFLKTFINVEDAELSADNFIQTDKDNWQITSSNVYIPSVYIINANNTKLRVDIRPFVKDDIKLWHTLFSNLRVISDLHINNSLSAHNNTIRDTDDMYILFAGGIGDWDSNSFTYEGDEFNLPIYKCGVEITQEELESLPTKYNLFTNPNHKCRYWDFTMTGYHNNYSIKSDSIILKQGHWLKNSVLTNITKPLKFNIDASLLADLVNTNCRLSLKATPSVTINSTNYDADNVIQQIKNVGSICKLTTLNNKSYNVLLTDITYSQTDSEKAELFETSTRIKVNDEEDLYYMPLNNSHNNITNLKDTVRNLVLSQDLTLPGTYNLILLKDSPYKIRLSEDVNFKLNRLFISDTTIKPFVELPQLRYPLNDPNNYEYNHKITENYKFNLQSATLFKDLDNKTRLENRQSYFLNYDFNNYAYYMINTYLYSRFSDTFTSIPKYNQQLCTMRLSELVAVDYPNKITFHSQAWFVDESNMEDLNALKTIKKEKVNEFYNKIMLNPAYKGLKDKSTIELNSEQYAMFDKEQIDTLVEYGYAIVEHK